jgi:GntR family transcriptional regulator
VYLRRPVLQKIEEKNLLGSDRPVRQPSLSVQVQKILMERISDGTYPPESQLPPENHLVQEFDVSRATIRSALDALTAHNLLVRKQGVGTFVTRIGQITNPLDRFIDFNDLIVENGYEPSFQQLSAEINIPTPKIASQLNLDPKEEVLTVHKIFSADGEPVIYCVNHIPTWVFRNRLSPEEALAPGITEPLQSFNETYCDRSFEYFISTVRAETAEMNDFLIDSMEISINTPVLVIDEVGYCESDRPVHISVEYHPGNRMSFGLIRRRR